MLSDKLVDSVARLCMAEEWAKANDARRSELRAYARNAIVQLFAIINLRAVFPEMTQVES